MISNDQYQNFIEAVINELDGDWLIVGGSLLSVVQSNSRHTVDIDLCPVDEMTNEKRLNLMDIAQKCKLSIEAINPAADFFVRQIANWKSEIILYKKGLKGSLFRPSLKLFFQLKFKRSSQSDLQDCSLYLQWHQKENLKYSSIELTELINNQISNSCELSEETLIQLQNLLKDVNHNNKPRP